MPLSRITAASIADGTIVAADIADGSVTSAKLSSNISVSGTSEIRGTSSQSGELRFFENTTNGTNQVAIKAADSLTSNTTFTLPSADGTTGQVLQTNGSGALSFVSISGGAQGFVTQATGGDVAPGGYSDSFALI